ncbi:MAG: hypothetical protein IM607_15630 [Cytophagales bacterium]|jgi:hypothetical protein|nr:hypothetical protein [Cytophagales bacterium]
MKDFSYIKKKKERERRLSRSISLPSSLWETYEKIAEDNSLNISDLIEEAMTCFYAPTHDLESAVESQQQPYQTTGAAA